MSEHAIDVYQDRSAVCPAPKNAHSRKGGSGGEAPQTLTRFYYFEPPPRPKNVLALLRGLVSLLDIYPPITRK